MGDCYQKIGKLDDAKKCYYKAYQTGDIEGMVLHNLAKVSDSAVPKFSHEILPPPINPPIRFSDAPAICGRPIELGLDFQPAKLDITRI